MSRDMGNVKTPARCIDALREAATSHYPAFCTV